MALTPEDDRRLRAELASFAPLLAMTGVADREAILDHCFFLIGRDPEWEDWLPYAREYLPGYDPPEDEGAPARTD